MRFVSKHNRLYATLATMLVLCSCTSIAIKEEQGPLAAKSNEEAKLKASIAELKRLYQAAQSEQERRAISLRAVDEGVIRLGASVSHVDEIFGTHFAGNMPNEKEAIRHPFILFANQPSLPPRPDGRAEGVSYQGSYMDLDYDANGAIRNYSISNLHKGGSRRTDGKEPMSVAELKRLYDMAKSEHERRDVTLKAIDEGVIQTFGPVNISTVDAIFGTKLASQLPKKEDKRTGIVDFASSPTTSAGTGTDGVRTSNGWFMAVEYYSNGNIASYYLTNVRN